MDTFQFPKPSGANTGAISAPMAASMLFALSATMFNLKSKLCKNQITIVATKIMVNALCKKSLAFSHICSKMLLPLGSR